MLCITLFSILSFTLFVNAAPKLIICSDSTAASYFTGTWQGWGFYINQYLTIPVLNLAVPAESSRSFISTGKWNDLLKRITPGDIVIIEFGHNDEYGVTHVNNELVYTLPGTGSNVVRVSGAEIHSYGWYLRKMIWDVKAAGGLPILSGRTPGNDWNGNNIVSDYPFVRWTEEVARESGVEFLDHTKYSLKLFQAMGSDVTKAFYAGDTIHNDAAGARLNAETLITAAKCARSVLTRYLSNEGNAVRSEC